MLAYNLMSLFRQAVLRASAIQNPGKEVQHTLKTLRYKLTAQGRLHHHRRPQTHPDTRRRHAPPTVDGRSVGSLQNLQPPGLLLARVLTLRTPNGKSGLKWYVDHIG